MNCLSEQEMKPKPCFVIDKNRINQNVNQVNDDDIKNLSHESENPSKKLKTNIKSFPLVPEENDKDIKKLKELYSVDDELSISYEQRYCKCSDS